MGDYIYLATGDVALKSSVPVRLRKWTSYCFTWGIRPKVIVDGRFESSNPEGPRVQVNIIVYMHIFDVF